MLSSDFSTHYGILTAKIDSLALPTDINAYISKSDSHDLVMSRFPNVPSPLYLGSTSYCRADFLDPPQYQDTIPTVTSMYDLRVSTSVDREPGNPVRASLDSTINASILTNRDGTYSILTNSSKWEELGIVAKTCVKASNRITGIYKCIRVTPLSEMPSYVNETLYPILKNGNAIIATNLIPRLPTNQIDAASWDTTHEYNTYIHTLNKSGPGFMLNADSHIDNMGYGTLSIISKMKIVPRGLTPSQHRAHLSIASFVEWTGRSLLLFKIQRLLLIQSWELLVL